MSKKKYLERIDKTFTAPVNYKTPCLQQLEELKALIDKNSKER
mgnify:CR=1 FL=1